MALHLTPKFVTVWCRGGNTLSVPKSEWFLCAKSNSTFSGCMIAAGLHPVTRVPTLWSLWLTDWKLIEATCGKLQGNSRQGWPSRVQNTFDFEIESPYLATYKSASLQMLQPWGDWPYLPKYGPFWVLWYRKYDVPIWHGTRTRPLVLGSVGKPNVQACNGSAVATYFWRELGDCWLLYLLSAFCFHASHDTPWRSAILWSWLATVVATIIERGFRPTELHLPDLNYLECCEYPPSPGNRWRYGGYGQ